MPCVVPHGRYDFKKQQRWGLSTQTIMKNKELAAYLSGFITPRRMEKMRMVLSQRTRHITVVLEDIYQSQNASAVLRSCECFGVQDVHIIENRYAFELNPEVVMGASKWLTLSRYQDHENNTLACLDHLKHQGYQLIATTPHKDDFTPATLPLDQKTALLFGTEMEGLSDEAREMADGYMQIPMSGFTESFNISVSVAVSLYHLMNRIRSSFDVAWQLPEEEGNDILFEWMCKSVKNADALIRHFYGQG